MQVLEADDLPAALGSVQLFCAATNGKLNIDKSYGPRRRRAPFQPSVRWRLQPCQSASSSARGCFPEEWDPTGDGSGLFAVEQWWVDMLCHQLQPAASTSDLGGCPHHAG